MKTISLACRGGGVKSASSIGVIKALNEMEFAISRLSGTSIASIICALYATGISTDDILQLLKYHVITYSSISKFAGGSGDFEIIENSVDIATGYKTFSQCNIPVCISASNGNFLFHSPIILSQESFPNLTLGKACRGSCSFPFAYKKYYLKYGDKKLALLDGGLSLNPFIKKDNNEVSILSTFYKREDLKENHASLYAHAWKQAEKLADYVIKPIISFGTFGFPEDLQSAFEIGYEETLKHYDMINRLVSD